MYLLYFWHGILKIKHGKMGNNFIPDEGSYPWHTQIPEQPLTVEHGKIWCEDEFNIPYAASILIDHHEKYVKDTLDKLNTNRKDEEIMAAKKTETREDTMGASLILTFKELKYIKSMIRNRIVHYECMKAEDWRGKKYSECSQTEKDRMDDDLETCYEIFDHLLRVGIREDVI